MNEQGTAIIDPETVKRLAALLGEITEKSHRLINQYLENTEEDDGFQDHRPGNRK